jgi:hypothetical protein
MSVRMIQNALWYVGQQHLARHAVTPGLRIRTKWHGQYFYGVEPLIGKRKPFVTDQRTTHDFAE